VFLSIVFPIYGTLWTWRNHLERSITNSDRQAKGQIQHTALAAVLQTGASQADICFFAAGCAVGFPVKDCKWARTNFALGCCILFCHTHKWIVRKTVLAY
jgi:hypothetical protein